MSGCVREQFVLYSPRIAEAAILECDEAAEPQGGSFSPWMDASRGCVQTGCVATLLLTTGEWVPVHAGGSCADGGEEVAAFADQAAIARPESVPFPSRSGRVVAAALAHSDLDVRIVEALPWVLAVFRDLDWGWLIAQCRLVNLQNRLGYWLISR